MLHTPIFPAAGAMAAWGGRPVRIHQLLPGNIAVIFGTGITHRVALSELAALPETDAFTAWKEARIEAVDRIAFNIIDDLFADYAAFCEAGCLGDFRIYSQASFARACVDHGFARIRRRVESRWGGLDHYAMGFNVALRPGNPRDAAPIPERAAPPVKLTAPIKVAPRRKRKGRA